jgi:hypothetical protein
MRSWRPGGHGIRCAPRALAALLLRVRPTRRSGYGAPNRGARAAVPDADQPVAGSQCSTTSCSERSPFHSWISGR